VKFLERGTLEFMRQASLVSETKKSEKYLPPPLEPYLQALAEPVALFSPALAEALGLPMPPGAFFEEDATIDEVRSALMEMKVGAPPQRPPLALNTAAARRESSPPADDPGLKAKPRKGSLTTVAPAAAESPRSRVHIDYSPWVSPAPSPRELPTQQQQQPPPSQSDRTATSRGGRSGGGLTSGGRGGAIRRPPTAPSTASGAASQRGSAPSSPRQRSASFGGAIGSSVVFSGSKSPSSPRLSGGGGAARPGPLIPKGRSPKSEDDGAREEQPEQQPAQQRRPSPSLHAVSLLFAPYRSPSASQACTPAQSPWQSPRAERSKEEQKVEPKRKKAEKEEPIFLETADV